MCFVNVLVLTRKSTISYNESTRGEHSRVTRLSRTRLRNKKWLILLNTSIEEKIIYRLCSPSMCSEGFTHFEPKTKVDPAGMSNITCSFIFPIPFELHNWLWIKLNENFSQQMLCMNRPLFCKLCNSIYYFGCYNKGVTFESLYLAMLLCVFHYMATEINGLTEI